MSRWQKKTFDFDADLDHSLDPGIDFNRIFLPLWNVIILS